MLASKMDKEDQIDLGRKEQMPKPNRTPAGMDSAQGPQKNSGHTKSICSNLNFASKESSEVILCIFVSYLEFSLKPTAFIECRML